MIKVKICGITNLEDAKNAVNAGCDALGFVFYKKSPRYIAPRKAARIIRNLAAKILKVGVFVNAKEKNIKRAAKLCRLDMLQFHGSESPEFCARFKGFKVIKAFRIKDGVDAKNILKYKRSACLFDTFTSSRIGGTGKVFNWKLLRYLDKLKCPIFLSGGLTSRNIKKAIRVVHPEWVDASSSLEVSPGKKDSRKVRNFIRAAKFGGGYASG